MASRVIQMSLESVHPSIHPCILPPDSGCSFDSLHLVPIPRGAQCWGTHIFTWMGFMCSPEHKN